jgi:hypothetical protein
MRSRPTVRLRITPSAVEPGGTFVASVELDSKTETPVDAVRISFGYYESAFLIRTGAMHEQELVWKPGKLGVGKHVKDVRFQVPDVGAPTFRGAATFSAYIATVDVDIPWWPDRQASFDIPVVARSVTARDQPPLVATSDGPRAGQLYVELSADRSVIAPGETLVGTVSFANVSTTSIRAVEAGFIRRETAPAQGRWHESNWIAQLLRGAPPEQESIPFRISIPSDAVPSFQAKTFAVDWRFEVRAKTTWGSDVVLGFPIVVGRRARGSVVGSQKPALVGRDRWAAVWEAIAERYGLSFSRETQSLATRRGTFALELRREVAGTHVGVVGELRHPNLGLGLSLHERSLSDLLAARKVPLRNPLVESRFVATAREPAQASAFLTPELLQCLLAFDAAQMDDDRTTFRVARAATTTQSLTPVVAVALQMLARFEDAVAKLPPPAAMAKSVPAWAAFAKSVNGRLELGRVWIHDAELGGERFEVGCLWGANGSSIETLVRLRIEPPFDTEFSVDDPGLSPVTREQLKVLVKSPGIVLSKSAISWVLPGAVPDPESLRPDLERAATIVRGRRGLLAAGPFR